jgi:hypothetical protein
MTSAGVRRPCLISNSNFHPRKKIQRETYAEQSLKGQRKALHSDKESNTKTDRAMFRSENQNAPNIHHMLSPKGGQKGMMNAETKHQS